MENNLTNTLEPALSPAEAATFLGLSRGTLSNMRVQGIGPNYIKFGRAVVYTVADLVAYQDAHRVVTGKVA